MTTKSLAASVIGTKRRYVILLDRRGPTACLKPVRTGRGNARVVAMAQKLVEELKEEAQRFSLEYEKKL